MRGEEMCLRHQQHNTTLGQTYLWCAVASTRYHNHRHAACCCCCCWMACLVIDTLFGWFMVSSVHPTPERFSRPRVSEPTVSRPLRFGIAFNSWLVTVMDILRFLFHLLPYYWLLPTYPLTREGREKGNLRSDLDDHKFHDYIAFYSCSCAAVALLWRYG